MRVLPGFEQRTAYRTAQSVGSAVVLGDRPLEARTHVPARARR